MVGLALAASVAGLVMVAIALNSANDTIAELNESVELLTEAVTDSGAAVDSLTDDVASVQQDVSGVQEQIGTVQDRLATIEALRSDAPSSSAPSATSQPGEANALPATMPTISGSEYYTGDQVTFGADDGVARVYLVFAHWCPYCQADLEFLTVWYPENRDRFPNTELVTISTFQDPSRGDHDLLLDEIALAAPVLMDPDASISFSLGNQGSVPYWVFVGKDGTVLGNHGGLLQEGQIDSIFTQLEELAAGT